MSQSNLRPSILALSLLVALAAASGAALAQQKIAAAPVSAPVTQPVNALEAIGPGDLVKVTVFRHPDLATDSRVNDLGAISFPLIGEVEIAGLSPQQAAKRIADRLTSGKFVVNPEVQVSIAAVNSRQVSVLGNVVKPGRYPIDNINKRVSDFVAAAGGMATGGADTVTVVKVRDGKESKTDVDLAQMFREGNLGANLELAPGDTIYVHRAPMIYVYGEVNKAGAYRLEPHMTVMQAIALGGGINARGTERGLKIHRRDGSNVKKIEASLTDQVRSDDVIYVKESIF